jgi:hypothetical protein
MSEDFTIYLISSKEIDSIEATSKITNVLSRMGFNTPEDAIKVDLDIKRGVFDEAEPEEKISLSKLKKELIKKPSWVGCAVQLYSKLINLYLLIAKTQVLNVYIDVSKRQLIRCYKNGKSDQFYNIITSLSKSIEAEYGFGEPEQPFIPMSSNEVLTSIHHRPFDKNFPASIGFISYEAHSEKTIFDNYSDAFEISFSLNGYWVLVEKEFLEIIQSLR